MLVLAQVLPSCELLQTRCLLPWLHGHHSCSAARRLAERTTALFCWPLKGLCCTQAGHMGHCTLRSASAPRPHGHRMGSGVRGDVRHPQHFFVLSRQVPAGAVRGRVRLALRRSAPALVDPLPVGCALIRPRNWQDLSRLVAPSVLLLQHVRVGRRLHCRRQRHRAVPGAVPSTACALAAGQQAVHSAADRAWPCGRSLAHRWLPPCC